MIAYLLVFTVKWVVAIGTWLNRILNNKSRPYVTAVSPKQGWKTREFIIVPGLEKYYTFN